MIYYICFMMNSADSGLRLRWWDHFLHPRFRHIMILFEVEERIVVLEFNIWGIMFDYHLNDKQEVLQGYKNASSAMLAFRFNHTTEVDKNKLIYRFLFNCVSMTKALFAIRNWRILTPYQLYKHLIKHPSTTILKSL